MGRKADGGGRRAEFNALNEGDRGEGEPLSPSGCYKKQSAKKALIMLYCNAGEGREARRIPSISPFPRTRHPKKDARTKKKT